MGTVIGPARGGVREIFRMMGSRPEGIPIVSIVGKTNSGKTTLIEKMIPELKDRGYRVGTIKHDVHSFEMDHPGKDTWRHGQAGADSVAISGAGKLAFIKKVDKEASLPELARSYFWDVDIILTEGYKRDKMPKIEVFRRELHKCPLCGQEDHLIALVSDEDAHLGVPCFTLAQIKQLADLVEERFLAGEKEEKGRESYRATDLEASEESV